MLNDDDIEYLGDDSVDDGVVDDDLYNNGLSAKLPKLPEHLQREKFKKKHDDKKNKEASDNNKKDSENKPSLNNGNNDLRPNPLNPLKNAFKNNNLNNSSNRINNGDVGLNPRNNNFNMMSKNNKKDDDDSDDDKVSNDDNKDNKSGNEDKKKDNNPVKNAVDKRKKSLSGKDKSSGDGKGEAKDVVYGLVKVSFKKILIKIAPFIIGFFVFIIFFGTLVSVISDSALLQQASSIYESVVSLFDDLENGTISEDDIDEASGSSNATFQFAYKLLRVSKKEEYAYIKIDAAMVASVFQHIASINKVSFADFTSDQIEEVVSIMYVNGSYNEHSFEQNLPGVLKKYLSSYSDDEIKDVVDDIFDSYYSFTGKERGSTSGGSGVCNDIPIYSTNLSKSDFVKYVNDFAASSGRSGAKVLADNAEKVYDISVHNGFNPELVIIRAYLEGYSPYTRYPSYNNFWGIKCFNNAPLSACANYSSVDEGILAYVNLVKGYGVDTYLKVYSEKHYAYLGSEWVGSLTKNDGHACYYYPYIEKYLDSNRASEALQACQSGSAIPTTDDDQLAYSKYQLQDSLNAREKIFQIPQSDCSNDGVEVSGEAGEVALYAVNTFDDYGYDQPLRMSNNYVDCSSMVWRSYKHFGLMMGGSENRANTSYGIYSWCQSNGKVIDGSNLQSGDLVFEGNSPSSIHHVEMYIGNNKTFGAHANEINGVPIPHDQQVSVVPYKSGSYNYYCRPMK